MRAVLDTNVLARAARPASPAAEVLGLLAALPHLLVLSPYLVLELARVMRYDRVRRIHGLDDAGIDAFVAQAQAAALLVNPPAALTAAGVVPSDPRDDPVITTAVAGKAEVLCTRDRHFYHAAVLAHCAQHGIRVLNDAELLRELRLPQSGRP